MHNINQRVKNRDSKIQLRNLRLYARNMLCAVWVGGKYVMYPGQSTEIPRFHRPVMHRQIGVCRFASKIICHCEPVRLSDVAIPLLRGEMYRKEPKKWELLRFLVVIVTWFHGAGGLPRPVCALVSQWQHYFQTPICRAASLTWLSFSISPEGDSIIVNC